MKEEIYWKDIIEKLLEKEHASWAAHVLSSNIEMFDEILQFIDKDMLIKHCLLCYSIAFSAQPDLDEILSRFTLKELISVYKQLEKKPIETAGALMWVLEDIDPEFGWANNSDERRSDSSI